RALCATFFAFAYYIKPGIRMSGLMKLPVVYVMTHDSIGVGEDGPTHQPMEQLVMVRSIPNVNVIRPCDGKETAAAFVTAFTSNKPTVIVETRQNLPCYEHNSGEKALKGGYVIAGTIEEPDVLLIATGSEVEPCMEAKRLLAEENIKARVISIPCMEIFDAQDEEYKEKVLPKSVKARVCVEAASHFAWYKYCRDYGELITMTGFGVSGPAKQLFEHFGFTAENIVEKAKLSIQNVKLDRYSH
ncbi:MAG: transketolase, partial [Clostridia bacterium]|nr:transketolase [Clostridia bacterium]